MPIQLSKEEEAKLEREIGPKIEYLTNQLKNLQNDLDEENDVIRKNVQMILFIGLFKKSNRSILTNNLFKSEEIDRKDKKIISEYVDLFNKYYDSMFSLLINVSKKIMTMNEIEKNLPPQIKKMINACNKLRANYNLPEISVKEALNNF